MAALDLTQTPVLAALAAVALGALAAIWFAPRAYARRWERRGVAAKDLAEVENSFRSTLVQLIGGAALVAALAISWVQISDAREASQQTLDLTRRGQVTERFTRAVAALGARDAGGRPALELRLGGIFGLRRVAVDAPQERRAVAEVMVAYLRVNHPKPRDQSPDPTRVRAALTTERLRSLGPCGGYVDTIDAPAPDAEAALQVAGAYEGGDLDSRGFDLSGLDLDFVRASGVTLRRSSLRETTLRFAQLENANLDFARVRRLSATFSCLRGASLVGARGDHVDLRGANLAGAKLRNAILGFAQMSQTCLANADLQGADLRGADLSGADFTDANLRGTNLQNANTQGAAGLTLIQLDVAKTSASARRGLSTPGEKRRACRRPTDETRR